MKRRANWTPAIVSNRLPQSERGKVSLADDAVAKSIFAASRITYLDAPPCETTKALDQRNQRRADLRFSIGVAIAFALPVFIALAFM